MIMKHTIMSVLFGAGLLASGCSPHQKSDSVTLQGTWSGRQLRIEHPCSLIISGQNYEFQDDSDNNAWNKGTFTLREDTTPRQCVLTINDCHLPQLVGQTVMAIYKLDGDTLTMTWNAPGKPAAPTAFDAHGAACMELKRK